MFSAAYSGGIFGMEAYRVRVEADISPGLPGFEMVGSLTNEVKEAKERVLVALKNAGIAVPVAKITLNLSPAQKRKDGTGFDLPIAAALLGCMEFFDATQFEDTAFIGELTLNGEIHGVNGALPMALALRKEGIKNVCVSAKNEEECALIPDVRIVALSCLEEFLDFLKDKEAGLKKYGEKKKKPHPNQPAKKPDFAEVCGQEPMKRAVIVAAAGFHHILFSGPPGAGKTMIAKRIPGIMPDLQKCEQLEVFSIYSIAGKFHSEILSQSRPYLSPHHTISPQALAGGGRIPKPGILSLAHRGVLFFGGYFCKTAETPNLRALWRFSQLEFFKKSAKNKLHSTFLLLALPLFGFSFAKRFMGIYTLMAKLYTIWQKEITKWRNYTRMAKGERAYGI